VSEANGSVDRFSIAGQVCKSATQDAIPAIRAMSYWGDDWTVRGSARNTFLSQHGDGRVDLGNEPPLLLSNEPKTAPVRRAVSMRWLGGTILTGLTSVFLMGGALTAALDNPHQFAELPDAAGIGIAESDDANGFSQTSDRMRPIEEEIATRQILQVSTVTRQGERDFI